MIEELRKKIPGEEFDYQALLDGLKEYSRPRDKITKLLDVKVDTHSSCIILMDALETQAFAAELILNPAFLISEKSIAFKRSKWLLYIKRKNAYLFLVL